MYENKGSEYIFGSVIVICCWGVIWCFKVILNNSFMKIRQHHILRTQWTIMTWRAKQTNTGVFSCYCCCRLLLCPTMQCLMVFPSFIFIFFFVNKDAKDTFIFKTKERGQKTTIINIKTMNRIYPCQGKCPCCDNMRFKNNFVYIHENTVILCII